MCVFHLFEPISNTFDKIHHPHSHQILLLPRYVDPTKLLVLRLDIRTDSNLLGQEGHISGLGERFNDVHMVVCIHLSICSNLRKYLLCEKFCKNAISKLAKPPYQPTKALHMLLPDEIDMLKIMPRVPFGQIRLTNFANTFGNFDKCTLQFGQIYFTI